MHCFIVFFGIKNSRSRVEGDIYYILHHSKERKKNPKEITKALSIILVVKALFTRAKIPRLLDRTSRPYLNGRSLHSVSVMR